MFVDQKMLLCFVCYKPLVASSSHERFQIKARMSPSYGKSFIFGCRVSVHDVSPIPSDSAQILSQIPTLQQINGLLL